MSRSRTSRPSSCRHLLRCGRRGSISCTRRAPGGMPGPRSTRRWSASPGASSIGVGLGRADRAHPLARDDAQPVHRRDPGRAEGGVRAALRRVVRLRHHQQGDRVGGARVLPDPHQHGAGREIGRQRASRRDDEPQCLALAVCRSARAAELAALHPHRNGGGHRARASSARSSANISAATAASASCSSRR